MIIATLTKRTERTDYLKWLENITDPNDLDDFFKNVYKSVKMVGKTESNGEGVVDFMFDEQEIVPDNTKQQKKEKKKTIVEIDAVKATNSLF